MILEVDHYEKWYKEELILKIDHFTLEKGKSYCLVGGNGSGKSTFIKSILGFLSYKGTITLHTDSISYLPERIQKIDFLSIDDYLNMISSLNEKTIEKEILSQYYEIFKLPSNKKVSSCSKGMFQKMNIILTLILDREFIIFDEPLNGLDPTNQALFVSLVKREKEKGKTILITTHFPSIYEGAYDKVLEVIDKTIIER